MPFYRLWITLFVFLCPASSVYAKAPAPRAAPLPDVKEWQLDNGLSVVYLGVHKAPVVTVQLWYHVGSKDEARDRRGSAHMFEHLMFKGTEHVPPEEHARHIDRLGGDVNAFTTQDTTAYHDTVPKEYLDFAVMLEAERMRHLLFLPQFVDSEREVVKEEKRVRVDNRPVGKALERFRQLAYTQHPYAWSAAGFIEDLDRLTPTELQAFYDAYYQPSNATLVVVGDVSEEEVRKSVDAWLGKIARAAEPPRPAKAAAEPGQTALRREATGSAQVGVVIGGYHVPPASSPDMFPLEVLAQILSGGESARLNQRIVRKDKSAVNVGAWLEDHEDPGLFLWFGMYLRGEDGAKVEAALQDEIARLHKEAVSARELSKAKNQLAAQYVHGLESVWGLAYQMGMSKMTKGDARHWISAYDKYQAVTAKDVMRVAKAYLVPENLTVVQVSPKEGR
jgi:zinc protease